MIQLRCPTCSRPFEIAALDELPTFPFCSERCRLIDLGRWADEKHVISGPPAPSQPPVPNQGLDHDDD